MVKYKIAFTVAVIFLSFSIIAMEEVSRESEQLIREHQQEFIAAIEKGEMKKVATLLDQGIALNTHYSLGYTALHIATDSGHKEIVAMLLDAGADSNAQTNSGRTALMLTVSKGYREIVTLLLDRGADSNAQDKNGSTALHGARDKEIIRLLLNKGANISARNKLGDTALMTAVWAGYEEAAAMLLDAGSDICATNVHGDTVMIRAVGQLMYGDGCRKNEVVALLLGRLGSNANIHAKNNSGLNALEIASCSIGHKEIAQLLELCSQPEIQEYIKNPQHFIENHGLNFTFNGKQTILMLASIFGHTSLVSQFKEQSSDFVNIKDSNNNSAFDYALLFNLNSAACLMYTFGDKVNAVREKKDALLKEALEKRYVQLIAALLSVGAIAPCGIVQGIESTGYLNALPRELFAYLLLFLK